MLAFDARAHSKKHTRSDDTSNIYIYDIFLLKCSTTRNFTAKEFIEAGYTRFRASMKIFWFFISSWITKNPYVPELRRNTYMYIMFNIRETSSTHDDENIIANKSIRESPISLNFKKTFRVE